MELFNNNTKRIPRTSDNSNNDRFEKSNKEIVQKTKRKCNQFPLMGKSLLLAKHVDITIMQTVSESDIISKLVLRKFKSVLDYYRQRSLRRFQRRSYFLDDTDYYFNDTIMEENVSCDSELSEQHDFDKILPVKDDQVTPQEEKVEYDSQKFLYDALGDELHNYPTSNSETESEPICIRHFNDDDSVGTSDISALLSRSNSSYSHFSSKLLRRNTYASSSMYDQSINDRCTNLNSDDSKAAQWINQATIQHQIIVQTSKALNLCLSCKEFKSSIEYIEAEKILLLAIEKREAVLKELKMMEYEDVTEDCVCLGHVQISNIVFPLVASYQPRSKLFTEWFFAIASCGPDVLATEVVRIDDQNYICFKKSFKFDYLPPDFEIIIKLYCLSVFNSKRYVQDTTFSCEMETTMCPTPNNLIGFHKKSGAKNLKRLYYSYERRQPSSTLCASATIRIVNLTEKDIVLSKLVNDSQFLGNVNLQILKSVEFSEEYSGFLTIGSEAGGCGIWNRRWCHLNSCQLKYWNYPQDQVFGEPINIIDLSYCVISCISRVNRELCARPRTLLIETGRLSKSEDKNSLMVSCKSSYTITRHYLSADTVEEIDAWEKRLNSVLFSLRNWNCMKCPLNFNN